MQTQMAHRGDHAIVVKLMQGMQKEQCICDHHCGVPLTTSEVDNTVNDRLSATKRYCQSCIPVCHICDLVAHIRFQRAHRLALLQAAVDVYARPSRTWSMFVRVCVQSTLT